MAWQWTPYTIPLIVTAAISAMLAVFVWQRRFAPSSTPFVLLILAVAEWSLGYALQLASVDLPAKTLCAGFKYLGVVVPVAWFSSALQYTERYQESIRTSSN